ncbi:MAG: UPF0182 family protein [Clostridia bacterium]|nr:UPF0182 family protein [Clostridia bacterium]
MENNKLNNKKVAETKENEEVKIKEEKENNETQNKKGKNRKMRSILVCIFLILFCIISYIELRGSYLEYLELGQNYTNIFKTNMIYRYVIMSVNFVVLYFIIYMTNRGIKKGLKPFFEKEKSELPKLPNKSLALVISAITSFLMSSALMQKIILMVNGTSFAIQDPMFGLDISYYIFQKPVIETSILYFIFFLVAVSLYMALYYVIVFNRYFDGVEGKMLKESLFMKKLSRNAMFIVIGIAAITIINTQNTMFGKLLTINDDIDIVGAGMTESTVKLWGYFIFAFIIVIFVYRALKYFKQGNTSKVLRNLAVIPGYLVALFVVMVTFDLVFVNSNELDKEKKYIVENIENTRNAYDINIEEVNLQNSGTITNKEVEENENIINNIPVISKEAISKTLEDSQTITGQFNYPSVNVANYDVNGKEKLVYVAPREITNSGRTYNNKTYERTHGMGEVIALATESTENGTVQYVQKDVAGSDEKIKISQPRIYFGTQTKDTVITNTKNKEEYDYTDEEGTEHAFTYEGKAGLKLGLLDKLILGIKKGDINLAFSGEVKDDSKILINREIRTRARKALPYLIYDENPYTVITNEGKIVWVLDSYTVASSYPYSQYSSIEHDGIREKINYIRNSIKVIIDAYDGTMSYYITDRNDPIAMAYRNAYKDLFADLDETIPEDISKHIVYPEFLYNVQAEIIKVYHNVKPDVLYRADDLWDISKYNSIKSTKSTGTYMDAYYTMLKTSDGEGLGLVQVYTPDEKQNIISYLVGTTERGSSKLKLYKFSADSNIVGPMQLDKQIEEDDAISTEINSLNVTGTKLTKEMIIVPIENTLLYVEPIYQTMLNESKVPILKKVVVASGNKLAIGNDLKQALSNLLSKYAVDIEVENTDDIEGIIEAIIKANKNLNESNQNNDWEMMGKDVKKIQDLIDTLEKVKEQEDKKKEELEKLNNTDNETINTIDENTSNNIVTKNTINE